MARISNFPLDDNVGLNDILVGSEYNGIGANNRPIYVTKNYRIGDLSNFFGLNVDTVAVNANKLSSLATFNSDGSLASLQNATISLINTATTGAGFATASSVTAVGSRVDVIMPGGGSTVSEAFANQVFTTTTNSDFAASSEVTEIKSQFTYNGDDINGLASGTIISTAIATSETNAVSTANSARATAETALVATISKVFRQDNAPAVTEPVNSIWYDTNDNNKSYVLVAGTPRVWTYTVDATLATSASVTTVSDALALANGNLSARYGIKVATGNVFAGMELLSNSDATGAVSDIIFTATNFKIKTIDSSGNVSPVAPFTVSGANGSNVVSINGTLKIGNTSLTDVTTKANSATQASDHSTIQAGTTAANVGLANVVNSNFDANGNVIGGAVGGVTINSTKIFQGTGTFGNTNTGFYLDNGGNFSLRNKLVFNGSTGDLSIAGAITATSGSIADGVTIGGTAASLIESNANNATTATAAAEAARTATKNAGAIGPVSITSTALQQGSGGYGNANAGFYMDSSGQFSLRDKLTVDSSGNLSIAGAISATSGSIADGVTIGGTAASTVKSGAASGATANQTSNADIRAVGAATSGTIAGISISGSELYQGAGTFGNANTGFYLGSNGTFSLKDKLSWNGTTLTINGNGTFSGNISAATGTFGGGVSGTGYTLNNSGLSLTNASSSISLGNSVVLNSNGLSGTGFALTSTGLVASSANITGVITATSGSFAGSISSATGTFTGGISGTGYTLNNSGLQLSNNNSSISLGNSVVISAGGLVGQGFELTSTGIEASSGLIGGWSIGSNLSSSDGEMTINPTTNSIQISEGTTVRVDINSSTTVSDPEQTGSINSGSSGLTTTTTTPSNQSGNISYSSGKNVFIYSSDTAQWSDSTSGILNKTVQYSISMSANGYTINVTDGSGDFVGTMSCTAGLAFSTSTSSSNIFHYTSSATASRSGGGSASISNTTVSGTFVWPNQNTVYVIGWNKNVSVSGTNYSGEPPSGPQTSTISFRTPVTTLANSNITLTISKCELVSGGLLIAKDTSNFFRVNRNGSTSYTNPFITSKGIITHYGNIGIGGNIKLGNPAGTSNGFAMIQHSQGSTSKLLIRNYSTGGISLYNSSNGEKFIMTDGGKIGASSINSTSSLGTTHSTYNLKWAYYGSNSGSAGAGNGTFFYDSSSRRYKENIIDYDVVALDKIKQVNTKKFNFINNSNTELGMIAEDLNDAGLEELVCYRDDIDGIDGNTPEAIDFNKVTVFLWKGIQEQQAIIESQKTLIDNLTERVTALEG